MQDQTPIPPTNPLNAKGLTRLQRINDNALVQRDNNVKEYATRSISMHSYFEPEGLSVTQPTIPAHVIIISNIPPKEMLNLACLIHTSKNLVVDPIFNHRLFTISHMFTNSTYTELRLIFVNSSMMQMQRLKVYLVMKNYCSMFIREAGITVIQLVRLWIHTSAIVR